MAEQFKISSQMTKKEIIEEYSGLLEAYKKKVKEAKESEKWRSEAEKYKEAVALEAAKEATVHGVIENVTNLKGLLGHTFPTHFAILLVFFSEPIVDNNTVNPFLITLMLPYTVAVY